MEAVGAALGDGVGYAAGRAAVFRRVVGSVDLELANRGLTNHVVNTRASALFREECLVIVAAIHRIVIQQT